MALMRFLKQWLRSATPDRKPHAQRQSVPLILEGMEDRLLLSSAPLAGSPILTGQWFVQSDGQTASISQSGTQLTLTNEQGTQTTGQWLTPTTFQAWGQTAEVVQNGPITQLLWPGNTWSQSTWQEDGLAGQWFVQANVQAASITQNGTQLVLTNEHGTQTTGQWLSPTSFTAWGQTAQIVQNGPITQILWPGNAWSRSTWQDGGLAGQWFVQSNGRSATVVQNGTQLLLTNEQGTQTAGQWLSPTTFQVWGQTAQIVQNGPITQILWPGNAWSQSTWQDGALAGQWFVQSNGQSASIAPDGTQLLLTNEQGNQTVGQWLSPTTFQAWGQTAQVVQNGPLTQILWPGNTWSQSLWQDGSLDGQWFVQSDGGAASIAENGSQLLITNEQGAQTVGQWLSPTTFEAGGQIAQIVEYGPITQIEWPSDIWSESTWQEGGLSGQWFVLSNGQAASIYEEGTQLLLVNEQGGQTLGQWLSPTSFTAWGQVAQIVQSGPVTQIQWPGNAWTQSTWQEGGLSGQWFVQATGKSASITQYGTELILTNEHGTQTTAQWLGPASFEAWGQTAQIVQNGPLTQILWNGNAWNQSAWQGGGLAGQWFVQSNGLPAYIAQYGPQLLLTNEHGTQTVGQWLTPASFKAWGQTAQIVDNNGITQIFWNGNTWTQTTSDPYAGSSGNNFVPLIVNPAALLLGGSQLLGPPLPRLASSLFVVGQAGSYTSAAIGLAPAAIVESGSLPAGLSFTNNGDGTATLGGTPAAGTAGTYSIVISTANGITPTATETLTLNVDQPPALTSGNSTTFTVKQTSSFTITTKPGTPRSTTLSENGKLPGGVTFTPGPNGTATLHGTPTAGSGGTYNITLTAANAPGSATSQTFTLTVNQAPSIVSAASTAFTAARAGSFTVNTQGFPTPSLTENGTLPNGVTFVDNGNGTATLSGTPAAGSGGTYAFTITAANKPSSVTQKFVLTINQPSVITSAASVTFTAGQSNTFIITTVGFPTARLLETGALPRGVTFINRGNGTAVLSGKPTSPSLFVLTITATNGVVPAAIQTLDLTVSV